MGTKVSDKHFQFSLYFMCLYVCVKVKLLYNKKKKKIIFPETGLILGVHGGFQEWVSRRSTNHGLPSDPRQQARLHGGVWAQAQ